MLSRVADSIYWMARYMERAEDLARLLLANQSYVLDAGATDETSFWQPILMSTGDDEAYGKVYSSIRGGDVQNFLTADPKNLNSITNCVRYARENARTVRDQIPDQVWRAVNDLYLFVTSDKAAMMRKQASVEFYEFVMNGGSLFQGVAAATMLRNEAWQFLQIGTHLERADKTSRLLDACSVLSLEVPPHPDAQPIRWQALLRSCSALHGYREDFARIVPRSVVEFLFLAETFARSIRFSMREVHLALKQLPVPPGSPTTSNPVRIATRLFNDLDLATVDEILAFGLHEYIDSLQTRLNAIGAAIFETHVLYADLTPINLGSVGEGIADTKGPQVLQKQQ